MDVPEKQKFRILIFRGNSRLKFFKNIQLGEIGFRLVQIIEVFAAPTKRLPFCVLNASGIHAALREDVLVLGSEVLANNGNHADIGEVTGSESEISSRAAEDIICASRRSGDANYVHPPRAIEVRFSLR